MPGLLFLSTEEKIEVYRCEVTCPGSHALGVELNQVLLV